MATEWEKTQFVGVRFREHPTRKFSGKPDRYFTIRYKLEGMLREEGLGWTSQGWNAQKASLQRSELIKSQKTGEGPVTLLEKRFLAKKKKQEDEQEEKRQQKENITVSDFFENSYFPNSKMNKGPRSFGREEELFKIWIEPEIGALNFKTVSPIHLENIKKKMTEEGRSARSIRYALAVVRQIFNHARNINSYDGPSPVKSVKLPQADNRRLRFLNQEEARKLLAELRRRSQQLYEIAFLSLRTGARADEIFSLKWSDVDFDRRTLTLWDTKNTKTRIAYLPEDAMEMLAQKPRGGQKDFVFLGTRGRKIVKISNSFDRAVKALGLNDDINDRRMKAVFHTLRHTYASWLVEQGTDLYTVKELMGHSTLSMTERYAHVGNNTMQNAVKKLKRYDLIVEPK